MTFFTLIGWLGTILYIISYLFLSLEKLSSQKKTYHFLNVLGACCLIVNAMPNKDYPNMVVNFFWGLIALFTIIKIHHRAN
ncbi:hypothetical protein LNJ05_11550 [Tenacibaculum finnmarkense genomovar ulcerans]|uniref:CBU_0592 family membrane protein n=1 Tax=Tenacibaculum finnmarkense TaxID=2781243 RepID=UPI001E452EDC|nr:hypothetical protein [Tenacibaculum finnmarkense]MCD8433395.1 hypothetical protein [Tenacibaculum finnmarkense genomovar ulcerans]